MAGVPSLARRCLAEGRANARTALSVRAFAQTMQLRDLQRRQAELAPAEEVNKWMDDTFLVDQSLGYVDRTSLWMSLRLLRGLEVPDFLLGSRHAYQVVQQLAAGRQWDDLEHLLHPAALASLQDSVDGRRAPCAAAVQMAAPDNISIRAAVLSRAEVLEPAEGSGTGTCHLFVRFEALQGFTMHDLLHGEGSAFADEPPRLQESTWTFEGRMSDDAAEEQWRVRDIQWRVWEVKPAEGEDWPGWPSHGP